MATTYSLRLDGHAIGLANCIAKRLEARADFAAFKMPHPLRDDSLVVFTATDEASARRLACEACDALVAELDAALGALPATKASNAPPTPAIRATLARRQISDEN